MKKYVDGFLLVIPKNKVEEYKKMAIMGRDAWMKHGALGYYECKGDDLEPQEMGGIKPPSFLEVKDASVDENVWFSFIIFKSKEHRDEVNKKVMSEMDESMRGVEIPFDMKRISYGGFEVEVEG